MGPHGHKRAAHRTSPGMVPIQQLPHTVALKVIQYLDIDSLLNIPKSLVHWNLAAEQEICRYLMFDVVESSPVKYHLKNPRSLSLEQILFENLHRPGKKLQGVEYLLKAPVSIPLRPQGNLQLTEKKHLWDFFYHVLSVSSTSSEVHFTPLTFQCNINFLFPSKNLSNPKFLTPKKLQTLWRKMTSRNPPMQSIFPDPKKHTTVRSVLGTKLFIRTKSRARFVEIE
ncbi:hypothetical protein K493DRAFT_295014 [Basidiobolus meristosporus CBS 931.73]|uniref:F-box domain-containing protein n=1 Tax=Basidiobolus meristosporus CBS 931.73 TaxID=1314790 RepID=A0A1Y1ZDR4_9FUNG|nr:hypothetical protein K493DRAFT_295014 [Basidiobolus meristosporus CBS 931.73]|eukprot:ORY08423.1 hypothetical protein K493DRAFT_295014 [Basidiobolus meristosporus CBS 931.73]